MTNNLGPVSSERIKVVESGLANVSIGRIVNYPLKLSLFLSPYIIKHISMAKCKTVVSPMR